MLRDLQSHEFQIYDRSRPPETMGLWYIDRLKQETADGRGHILVAEGATGVILGYASLTTRVSAEDEKDEVPYTYAHVGDELLFELVAICRPCHERLHPKSSTGYPELLERNLQNVHVYGG